MNFENHMRHVCREIAERMQVLEIGETPPTRPQLQEKRRSRAEAHHLAVDVPARSLQAQTARSGWSKTCESWPASLPPALTVLTDQPRSTLRALIDETASS